uniref:mannose-6-phosphate isomerase n=2 Tax=Rhodosorus marinus TaxID=101924 RepID=A0A7S3EB02_9RHOD|mmetsp:Transcript_19179/g.76860  ORF Transcript_19179/g.76860 Transcript_19179/m.76860 type:complete len:424 (+) Transcript_19179:225-1496(+)
MATLVAEKPVKTVQEDQAALLSAAMVPILAKAQNYAWGISGGSSLVASIYSRNSLEPADGGKPYAELWMGTHPSGPSRIQSDPSVTLSSFLDTSENAFTIGEKEVRGLPYLLKILSVGGALSIQAHPTRELAKTLHAQNPSAYKDENHKPEMAIALSPFQALCGFRDCNEIVKDVARVPEFADAIGRVEADEFVKSIKGSSDKAEALKKAFGSLMRQDEAQVTDCLKKLVQRLGKMEPEQKTPQDKTLNDLYAQYPGDVGCFAAYLMNKLDLEPNDAIFIGANEPHAYLQGECVEIMANSDNVVRAGLTPKFKDVDVLVEMLTYKDGPPEVMKGDVVKKNLKMYRPPCEDFQLEQVDLKKGESVKLDPAKYVLTNYPVPIPPPPSVEARDARLRKRRAKTAILLISLFCVLCLLCLSVARPCW